MRRALNNVRVTASTTNAETKVDASSEVAMNGYSQLRDRVLDSVRSRPAIPDDGRRAIQGSGATVIGVALRNERYFADDIVHHIFTRRRLVGHDCPEVSRVVLVPGLSVIFRPRMPTSAGSGWNTKTGPSLSENVPKISGNEAGSIRRVGRSQGIRPSLTLE